MTIGVLLLAETNFAATPADVVFTNGNFYTGVPAHPTAQAVVVAKHRIVFVGTSAGARRYTTKSAKVVDLHGATAVPGLTDAHYHLSAVGEREISFNLEGTSSLQDLQRRLKERAKTIPAGRWVVGRGWIETHWSPPVFPTRQDLDAAVPDHPVFLRRSDGHGAVANSMALKLARIDKSTASPPGGEIEKDPATGEPTGMLKDNAMGRIAILLPRATAQEDEQAMLLAVKRSLSLGLCEVHIPGNSWKEIQLIRRLYAEGRIPLRIYDAISRNEAGTLFAKGPILNEFDHHFTLRSIKLYADGSLGSKSAALLAPYEGETASGFMVTTEAATQPILKEALRKGIQIMTHAIGDRANRSMLDWYETAFKAVPPSERAVNAPRWRIEHAQLVAASDLGRFAKLGVIPSMQPSHAIGDLYFAPSRLGMERLSEGYAWKSFLRSGSIICAGSDAPVEVGDPIIEFYAAVARKALNGFSGPGWHPEERVSRDEALNMLTKWAAYAAFEEKDKGTLEVGKLADITVLSRDIMKLPKAQIPKTKCVMTVIGGEVAYTASPRSVET